METVQYAWNDSAAPDAFTYIEEKLLKCIPTGKPLRIADLGCGNGYFANLLAEQGHAVTALDFSEEGIRIARQAYPKVSFHSMSVYDDLVAAIGKDYDVVVASEVIEHLFNPKAFMDNARALLAPGGLLVLTTPYHGYLKNCVLALTGKLDKHFTVDWDCGHIKFFSVKTLGALVADKGFKNIRFSFAGRLPFLWKSMILVADRDE
jgi:2-polyprenyl-3-methyl-5-hydroxy-6-metoxy-1,4-benzoquinol methylase